MSQVFTLRGDSLAELSRLVKRVGDQQKELVLEISKQLSRHNEMVEKAVEKQARMEDKIVNIEEQLRKKASIGYDRKREKLDAIKIVSIEQKRQAQLQSKYFSLINPP